MPMFLMSFNYVEGQKDQNSEMWQFVWYLWSCHTSKFWKQQKAVCTLKIYRSISRHLRLASYVIDKPKLIFSSGHLQTTDQNQYPWSSVLCFCSLDELSESNIQGVNNREKTIRNICHFKALLPAAQGNRGMDPSTNPLGFLIYPEKQQVE